MIGLPLVVICIAVVSASRRDQTSKRHAEVPVEGFNQLHGASAGDGQYLYYLKTTYDSNVLHVATCIPHIINRDVVYHFTAIPKVTEIYLELPHVTEGRLTRNLSLTFEGAGDLFDWNPSKLHLSYARMKGIVQKINIMIKTSDAKVKSLLPLVPYYLIMNGKLSPIRLSDIEQRFPSTRADTVYPLRVNVKAHTTVAKTVGKATASNQTVALTRGKRDIEVAEKSFYLQEVKLPVPAKESDAITVREPLEIGKLQEVCRLVLPIGATNDEYLLEYTIIDLQELLTTLDRSKRYTINTYYLFINRGLTVIDLQNVTITYSLLLKADDAKVLAFQEFDNINLEHPKLSATFRLAKGLKRLWPNIDHHHLKHMIITLGKIIKFEFKHDIATPMIESISLPKIKDMLATLDISQHHFLEHIITILPELYWLNKDQNLLSKNLPRMDFYRRRLTLYDIVAQRVEKLSGNQDTDAVLRELLEISKLKANVLKFQRMDEFLGLQRVQNETSVALVKRTLAREGYEERLNASRADWYQGEPPLVVEVEVMKKASPKGGPGESGGPVAPDGSDKIPDKEEVTVLTADQTTAISYSVFALIQMIGDIRKGNFEYTKLKFDTISKENSMRRKLTSMYNSLKKIETLVKILHKTRSMMATKARRGFPEVPNAYGSEAGMREEKEDAFDPTDALRIVDQITKIDAHVLLEFDNVRRYLTETLNRTIIPNVARYETPMYKIIELAKAETSEDVQRAVMDAELVLVHYNTHRYDEEIRANDEAMKLAISQPTPPADHRAEALRDVAMELKMDLFLLLGLYCDTAVYRTQGSACTYYKQFSFDFTLPEVMDFIMKIRSPKDEDMNEMVASPQEFTDIVYGFTLGSYCVNFTKLFTNEMQTSDECTNTRKIGNVFRKVVRRDRLGKVMNKCRQHMSLSTREFGLPEEMKTLSFDDKLEAFIGCQSDSVLELRNTRMMSFDIPLESEGFAGYEGIKVTDIKVFLDGLVEGTVVEITIERGGVTQVRGASRNVTFTGRATARVFRYESDGKGGAKSVKVKAKIEESFFVKESPFATWTISVKDKRVSLDSVTGIRVLFSGSLIVTKETEALTSEEQQTFEQLMKAKISHSVTDITSDVIYVERRTESMRIRLPPFCVSPVKRADNAVEAPPNVVEVNG